MIEHTVTFSLIHAAGSAEEADFLASARELTAIPGVQDFRVRRQVNGRHPHAFGITMRFASQEDYDIYNADPRHGEFVEKRWLAEVSDFQEADFVDL